MSFLNLEDKTFLVLGVANKKSVAYHIGKTLEEQKAKVLYAVHTEERKQSVADLLAPAPIYVCDMEQEESIAQLVRDVGAEHKTLHGMVHSLAFANYSDGFKPFHETVRKDFLQAVNISCFSFVALANGLKELFDSDASVVTISISTTRMAAENYGFMAPAKAALDSSVCFLAKSFSGFSRVRFNSVNAGLLKTSSSAGIPGYINCYLHAEKATLRKKGLATQEVANAAVFLLSPRSSGINAQGIVLDAGMSINYFDKDLL